MDLNPYTFTAPWTAYEFAHHVLRSNARLVVLSMAWLTRLTVAELGTGDDGARIAKEPDWETVAYWVERLRPLVQESGEGNGEREVVVVFANRCGVEPGVEEEARYAGSSAVVRIRGGEVEILGGFGRGEEGVLVCDTDASTGR